MSAPATPATTDAPDPTRGFLLDAAPHEFGGNLIFTEHGLRPYHALDAVVKAGGGSARATFEHAGEEWMIDANMGEADAPDPADDCPVCSTFLASLSYHKSGFAPPDDPSINFRQEVVREFEIHVRPMNDEVGKRKAHFNVSPRWPEMKTTDGERVSTPDITGVNVTTQGSNLPVEAYPDLLRAAADALDINAGYFDDIHEYSNIFAFERYVRIARSKSGRVFGTNSPMRRIFEHVDGHGKFRELREDDRKGIEGYHHRVRLDSAGAAALIPGHGYGKRIKHYHPEHPREDPSDPLYHPKAGVSLQSNLNTDGAVAWSDRDDLREELDETLINLLSWAGLPTRPTGETFIEDAYFVPSDSARSLRLIEDPTEGMEQQQRAAALATVIGDPDDRDDDGLNATEREAARVLADGGQQDVTALAEQIGRSKRTLYRVLDSLGDVVENDNGTVGFASDYLAEQVAGLLSSASATTWKDAESGGSDAWAAFLARYGPEVGELPGETVELDFGIVDPDTDMKAVVRKGLTAWLRSGRERRRFVRGVARWIQDGKECQVGGKFGKMDLPLRESPRVKALD